ncbi:MAG: hypothetical protein CSA18_01100 [Deltaproteobacteria bacterium]|nr:MAG: hypothetical protein CSA18_01100 [Deltaproteobacteria bacterium]
MKNMSMYDKAHLLVSAIRVLEYKKNHTPPDIKELSDFLNVSQEEILFILRKLEEKKIINMIEKNFLFRVSIKDHTLIESISKDNKKSKSDLELQQFKEKQKNRLKEIEDFQKKQKLKQKELFDKLNKDLQFSKKD